MLSRRLSLNSKVYGFAFCACLAVFSQSMEGPAALAQDKKKASLADPPVGSKSTQDLMRRLSKAYDTHNDAMYLSLFQTSIVHKLRLQIQFDRDSKSIARNFRYVTPAQEKARLGAHLVLNIDKKTELKIDKSPDKKTDKNVVKPLPVCGYVDFDLKESPNAPPDVIGVPVGQSKELYYLMAL